MGFRRRKMEDQCRTVAEKEAAARHATDRQVLEDAERLIDAWNERQAKRMPMLFSPTIGRRHRFTLLVPVGVLPSVPHHERDRPVHPRPPPRGGRDQSQGLVRQLSPPDCSKPLK
jgi:hypothetical protein